MTITYLFPVDIYEMDTPDNTSLLTWILYELFKKHLSTYFFTTGSPFHKSCPDKIFDSCPCNRKIPASDSIQESWINSIIPEMLCPNRCCYL